MRITYCLALLLMAGLVSADAGAAQQSVPGVDRVDTSGNHLESGDIVRLRIWREETMSGEFTVDPDGNVVLPRLGLWQVAGKDPVVLKAELVEEYGRYLRTPSIEVTFLRRIHVGGAVQRPGVYHVDPTVTIRHVLLEAGGAGPVGRTDKVELIRDGEVIQAQVRQDVSVLESPVRSGDELYVPERNWFSRNIGATVGIGGALLSFAATMIILAASN